MLSPDMPVESTYTSEQNDRLRDWLRVLMASNGWNQKSAAEALGVTQQMVSTFLGHRGGAGQALALAIARLSGAPLEHVLSHGPGDKVELKGPKPMDLIEEAVGAAFNGTKHHVRDLDAVRAAFRGVRRIDASPSDLAISATWWLKAAAELRSRGADVTCESLLIATTEIMRSAVFHEREIAASATKQQAAAQATISALRAPFDTISFWINDPKRSSAVPRSVLDALVSLENAIPPSDDIPF